MPAPRSPWESDVDAAMQECIATFGDGRNADGTGKVTYMHFNGGLTYDLDGIFEAASEQVSIENDVQVVSYQPVFSTRLALMRATPGRRDTLLIRGKTYRVVEPTFDGQGTVTLRLAEV